MTQLLVATYTDSAVITPSDTVDAGGRALYIGGLGNVSVVMESGVTTLFSAIPVGTTLPISFKRINATNTTATLLVALR